MLFWKDRCMCLVAYTFLRVFPFLLLSSVNPAEADIQCFPSERTHVPRSGNNEAVSRAVYRWWQFMVSPGTQIALGCREPAISELIAWIADTP